MNIGFACLYAYRPHVKHLAFLASEAQRQGNEVYMLECNSAVDLCAAKLGKSPIQKKIACMKCVVGGLRGFLDQSPDQLIRYVAKSNPASAEPGYSAISTVASHFGMSEEIGTKDPEFQSMAVDIQKSIDRAQAAAEQWINHRKLDAVFCFNGRIDLTHSVMKAAASCGIPFVSVERSWHGLGIQLTLDGTPLTLGGFYDFVSGWREKPLTSVQLWKAFGLIADRFRKKAVGEFRQYNADQQTGLVDSSQIIDWLYLPSSIFERIGHPDWKVDWKDDLHAIEQLIERGVVSTANLVVRGHPQWTTFSPASDQRYREWSSKLGIRYIPSDSALDTRELIRSSNAILVYGSSAAFEAGLLGKPILNLSPTFYFAGGFLENVLGPDEISSFLERGFTISPQEIVRNCLRTIYTINFRYMQFTEQIQADDPYEYRFKSLGNTHYFEDLIRARKIAPDNATMAPDSSQEDAFLATYMPDMYSNIRSEVFYSRVSESEKEKGNRMYRKPMYKFVDFIDSWTR